MNVFTTVADDHIIHHSTDGQPLENQPNATFGHRTDWFDYCRFCTDLIYPQRWAVA